MNFIEKHLLRGARPRTPWRVGLLGLVHETNTFESGCTEYAAFAQPVDREPLLRGEALWQMRGTRSVMGGMLDAIHPALRDGACELVPMYRASCAPSPMVTQGAWQRLHDECVMAVAQAGPVDALLIELHGAMAADGEPDCEGALLVALRDIVGPHCLIVATLDFHANVSAAMVEHADMLVPYRTYPHIDMFDTGMRAVHRSLACLHAGRPFAKAWRQAEFLVPLVGQYTEEGPMAALMQQCKAIAQTRQVDVALSGGFPLADTPDTGLSIVVYAEHGAEATAQAVVDELMAVVIALRVPLTPSLLAPEEAVSQLLQGTTTVLADVADNPGAGCAAKHLGILKALHAANVPRALVATLQRPDWAHAAHAAGVGRDITVELDATSPNAVVATATLRVLALSDGRYTCTGAMWQGREIRQGPTARLQWGTVELIVACHAVQALDLGALACVGVEPSDYDVLSLKSSVHYRAAYGRWAQRILNVDAYRQPGVPSQPLTYRHLRAGVAVPA